MDDEPTGNISTTLSVEVGGSATGTIEVEGDIDYFAVELEAGVTYQIDLEGSLTGAGTLGDPFLEGVFNAAGVRVAASNDDGGVRANSRILFTPTETGTYYIAATNFQNVTTDDVGSYTLFVETEALSDRPDPIDVEGYGLFGDNLIDALAAGGRYSPDSDNTTRVTYSIPDEQSTWLVPFEIEGVDITPTARQASDRSIAALEGGFSFLEAVTNLEFIEVEDAGLSFGTIRLAANGVISGRIIGVAGYPSELLTGGDIFIFEDRITGDGFLESVVLHELGHALGLSHHTDGRGALPTGFGGDEFTQMSPSFSSVFFPSAISADLYPTSYGYLDILALRAIYGGNDAAFTGNTVYEFDLSERYWQTIYDLGGTDTIRIIGADRGVTIDLTPNDVYLGGTFIDVGTTVTYFGSGGVAVGTRTETVFLSPETVIENVTGGGGDDRITGNAANNRLRGEAGDDILIGAAGDDTLVGGEGRDLVSAGPGDDFIFAGTGDVGDDFLAGDGGDDVIAGGAGDDFLVGGGHSGSVAGLGDAGSNTADDGADTLFGGEGNDTLLGGAFDDLDGDGKYGSGEATAGEGVNVLYGGAGDDLLVGGAGADTLGGGAGDDTVEGGGGADIIYGGAGDGSDTGTNDIHLGGAGNDKIFASGGNDSVEGGTGDDTLFGGAGADTIGGGADDDLIYGGDGADLIGGGLGADTLRGGAGNDVFTGGAGADLFVFSDGDGIDIVTDFDPQEDQLDLSGVVANFADVAALAAASLSVTIEGSAGLLINLGGDDSLFLKGLSRSDISAMDIVL